MTKTIALSLVGLIVLAFIALLMVMQARPVEGSVNITQEYMATSTAANNAYGANTSIDFLIRKGSGSLGSVIITGANTGTLNFYNATTSDITKRASSFATSSILIASLPASLAAGTYIFDASYNVGLLQENIGAASTLATTTVTYR